MKSQNITANIFEKTTNSMQLDTISVLQKGYLLLSVGRLAKQDEGVFSFYES